MSQIDWVIFVVAWSLIPACLLARAYFDRQAREGEKRCQEELAKWLKTRK